jgi:hypothetical protein
MRQDLQPLNHRSSGLVDVLDRVLDKGLAIAGDIRISLAEVELLTIRIRLIVCSIDKAQEIGLDWWKHDRHLASAARGADNNHHELLQQLRQLERKVEALGVAASAAGRRPRRARTGAQSPRGRMNDAR